jgi:Tfp pilus assembly PilM family ATPase
MASNSNTVSGLDINSLNICYSRCLLDDKAISNICIQPLEVDAEDYWESVSTGLDELFKEFKIPGEDVVSSLPGEYAIIKKILLDNDENDTNGAIEWELSQQIIGSIDEYVFDYQSIAGAAGKNCKSYLAVCYRESAISRISKLLKKKKLNPLVIDLDIFALINVFEMNYSDRLSLPALIIFSDMSKTKLILTCNGEFIDFEIFDHNDGEQSTEDYLQVLDNSIKKLIACNPELSKSGELQAYVTGSNFYQSDITDIVLEKVKNSEILYPFRTIPCSAGMDEEKLKEFAPQLSVSVGLAMRAISQNIL